jgi:WD40 repeat protein
MIMIFHLVRLAIYGLILMGYAVSGSISPLILSQPNINFNKLNPITQENVGAIEPLGQFRVRGGQIRGFGWPEQTEHVIVASSTLWVSSLTGQPPRQMVNQEDILAFTSHTESGLLAYSDSQSTIYVLDATFNEVLRLTQPVVTALAFNPNGGWLASGGGDGLVQLWDIETGRVIFSFLGENDPDNGVTDLDFSADGMIMISSHQRTDYLWDLSVIFERSPSPIVAQDIGGAAFDTNGQSAIFSVKGASLRNPIFKIEVVPSQVRDTAHHPNVPIPSLNVTLSNREQTITDLMFNPDGTLLLIATTDGILSIWATETGERLIALPANTTAIEAIAMNPQGTLIIMGNQRGGVQIWGVP